MNLFTFLFGKRAGFGVAGINRQRECGAILIAGAGLTAAQFGNETDETGLNLESIEVRYFREINEKLPGLKGQTRGRALADKFSREVTVAGEVLSALGLMAFTAATVDATLANDISDFGAHATTGGDLIFDEGTVTQNRSGWRSVSMKFSSDPELV